jgi:hypothetical protein
VPQFQVSELTCAVVGGETGEPVPVKLGEPQLRAGLGTFLAEDHRIPADRPGPAGR